MSTQMIPAASQMRGDRRPLPADTDYLGKGRIAACCARRRYHLQPDQDEMDELINHAASVYWHYLEVQNAPPGGAWLAARDRSATYYFRKMRGARCDYLGEVKIVHLEDPILDSDDVTFLDSIAAAGQEATDMQRLDWLGREDLVVALIEGRKAAGRSNRMWMASTWSGLALTNCSKPARRNRQYRWLRLLGGAGESGTKESLLDRSDIGLFPCAVLFVHTPGRVLFIGPHNPPIGFDRCTTQQLASGVLVGSTICLCRTSIPCHLSTLWTL